MDAYLPTIIGVVVSAGLFLLGYRQTIGAKKERVRTANTDIEKILLKRMVLETYKPTVDDVARLIDGKARDYQVDSIDLFSVMQFLNTLFTRLTENDFITQGQREEILKRLISVLIEAEGSPVREAEVIELQRSPYVSQIPLLIPIAAILASMIGAFASILFESPEFKSIEIIEKISIVFGVSITVIIFLYLFRIRVLQEEPSSKQALEAAIDFEREVGDALQEFGILKYKGLRGRGYDFSIEINGKRIIIEVKAWAKKIPLAFLRELVERFQNILESEKADEVIIVTRDAIDFPSDILRDTRVKIMTLKELKNYFTQMKAQI